MRTAVFAGTTEGREICTYLEEKGICYTAFTATELGADLLPKGADVHMGRLDAEEMSEILKGFDLVIDATHPYAAEATKNIKAACGRLGKRLIRLLRDECPAEGAIYAKDISQAAELLKNTGGKIFVSTGSKEAEKYTVLENFETRIRIRVLDIPDAMENCLKLGFSDIISARGPFSVADNIKHFYGCQWLVTKSSGSAGGFEEKLMAANELGMKIIVIKRPQESGFTMEEAKKEIDFIIRPMDIEKKSLEIIDSRLGNRAFSPLEREIVKRVIHTTADFDYADNIKFSENAAQKAAELLKSANIVTDTNMALMGINRKILESLGGSACCFMADDDVAAEAKKRGITRAAASMEKAAAMDKTIMLVCGNAPTALIAADRLIKEGKLNAAFIIAVPVGFVNVIEAKELIIKGGVPNITSVGNKGGSGVAAAIVNALLYSIKR